MLEHISSKVIGELKRERLNLSSIWLLERFYSSPIEDIDSSLLAPLERRLLVVDGKISKQGIEYLEFLKSLDSDEVVQKKDNTEWLALFEDFWEAFPRNDTFDHKGKSFQGSRSLKTGKKDKMRSEFLKILAEGEFTGEQIITALKTEVRQKMEMSVKTGENKMRFMQSMPPWLNQRSFQGFVGETKSNTDNEFYI